jgi:hypothetical protein
MQIRPLAKVLAAATAVAASVFLIGLGASSASATTPEHLTLSWEGSDFSTFTLPTNDGFDDSIRLNITSNKIGTVDVTSRRLSGHGGSTFVGATSFVLGASGPNYIADPGFTDTGLTAGSWKLTLKINGVTKTTVVRIGSGVATSVKVTTSPSKVFVGNDAAPHLLTPHVVAKDELGTSIPIANGTLSYTGPDHGTAIGESVSSSGPTVVGATPTAIDVEGDHSGVAKLTVQGISGPVSSSHPATATVHPTLSVPKLTSLGVTTSFATMYPNATGTKAPEDISLHIKSNTGVTLPLEASTITITKGSSFVGDWSFSQTGYVTQPWDGHNVGNVVAGKYTVRVIATLPGGNTLTKSTQIEVSSAIPVQHTITVSYPGSVFTKKHVDGAAKCTRPGSVLDCVSATGESGGAYIREPVPATVLKFAKPLGYTATMAVTISGYSASTGEAEYSWGGDLGAYSSGVVDITSNGIFQDGPRTALNNARDVYLQYNFGSGISLDLTKFTVTYKYWALPTLVSQI